MDCVENPLTWYPILNNLGITTEDVLTITIFLMEMQNGVYILESIGNLVSFT